MSQLRNFVAESNRIEGIYREPTQAELAATERFLTLEHVTVEDVSEVYSADPAYATAAALLQSMVEISKERAVEHGGVSEEWTRTAEIWSALLGVRVEPHQAMAMMTANKLVRLFLSPREDHFGDGANYLALAWGVLGQEAA